MTGLPRADLIAPLRWLSPLPPIPPRLEAWLAARFPEARAWPCPEGSIDERPSAIDAAILGEMARITGRAPSTSLHDRAARARGMSTEDLVRARLGDPGLIPEAVLEPATHEQVLELLALCSRAGVPVTARGGGTSVTGAVAPGAGGVVFDLVPHMAAVVGASPQDGLLTAQAGIRGPALEDAASRFGATIGHFPQSFERSTLGGWIAARSAGQLSNRYGRADQLLVGLRAAAPAGEIVVRERPAAAVGPDIMQLLAGSEGALAIITEATVRTTPAPRHRRFASFLTPGFAAGLDLARTLAQEGLRPALLRLSDEEETERMLIAAPGDGMSRAALRWLVRKRPWALLNVINEGPADVIACERRRIRRAALAARALPLGSAPARAWWATRFSQPALRESLLERGLVTDTMETAVVWSRLPALHQAVRATLADLGASVGVHVSHLYPEGGSLYVTYLFAATATEAVEKVRAARGALACLFRASGAPLSHQHGAGKDLAHEAEGALGQPVLTALRELKRALDPNGVMNPGTALGPAPTERAHK